VNSRLDPIQAAVLRVKLTVLDEWNERRGRVAAWYSEALAETDFSLPYVLPWADPVWHLYVVRSPRRDALQARLAAAGIATLIHYPIPPHMQTAYANAGIDADALPLARRLADEVLSLPIGPHLGGVDAMRLVEVLKSVV
jgi:dTDP-4-amino-4,6-dideoxygalactose transaminase